MNTKMNKWNVETVRDSQRQKLYDWEYSIMPNKGTDGLHLNEEQCRELIDKSFRWFTTGSVKGYAFVPKIIFNKRGSSSHFQVTDHRMSRNEIKIHKDMMEIFTVLHEVAHAVGIETEGTGGRWVVKDPGSPVACSHDPMFVRHFIELLVRFNVKRCHNPTGSSGNYFLGHREPIETRRDYRKKLEETAKIWGVKVAPRTQSKRCKKQKQGKRL